eukprot:6487621-Amphidinium_carterae.1
MLWVLGQGYIEAFGLMHLCSQLGFPTRNLGMHQFVDWAALKRGRAKVLFSDTCYLMYALLHCNLTLAQSSTANRVALRDGSPVTGSCRSSIGKPCPVPALVCTGGLFLTGLPLVRVM